MDTIVKKPALSLEELNTWKIEALQKFLSVRGLSKEGRKGELIALCFAAAKLDLPVTISPDEVDRENKQVYLNLLSSCNIPDPFTLNNNWENEANGIAKWPPVFLTDICTFFNKSLNPDVVKKYLNQYKLGKAYTYYDDKWLKEIYINCMSSTSEVCILRAKCCPSQRLNEEFHEVWACIVKQTGEIRAAYCTCAAGLSQTCNHVAGLLYRVEAANRQGISCTSLPCTWIVPTDTKGSEPALLSNLSIKKACYGKARTRPLVSAQKKKFTPVRPESGTIPLEDFVATLKGILPNACFLKGCTLPVKTDNATQEPVIFTPCRPTDLSLFDVGNMVEEMSHNQEDCIPALESKYLKIVSDATIGQFDNPQWVALRDGRITASKFHAICTRVRTYNQSSDTNIDNLLKHVMGYVKLNPNIKQLKHGRETEPLAKLSFLDSYARNHINPESLECGMYLLKEHPYISASPDLLIECTCCGKGLLEVKCPLVSDCNICEGFCYCKQNLPAFLHKVDDNYFLKENHAYFAQVQGQMGITNRKWCDFYVFTNNGSLSQRIEFNQEYFDDMLCNFFYTFVVPEVLSKKLFTVLNTTSTDHVPMDIDDQPTQATSTLYFCPVCRDVIREPDAFRNYNDRSIECEKCNFWFHFKCVGVTNYLSLQKHGFV